MTDADIQADLWRRVRAGESPQLLVNEAVRKAIEVFGETLLQLNEEVSALKARVKALEGHE